MPRTSRPDQQHPGEVVMPVHQQVDFDDQGVAEHPLDGVAAAVHVGANLIHHDPPPAVEPRGGLVVALPGTRRA